MVGVGVLWVGVFVVVGLGDDVLVLLLGLLLGLLKVLPPPAAAAALEVS